MLGSFLRLLLFGLLSLLFLFRLFALATTFGFHLFAALGGHELFHAFAHHAAHVALAAFTAGHLLEHFFHASAVAAGHLLFPDLAHLDPLGHLGELLLDDLNAHLVSSFLRELVDLFGGDVLFLDELLEELEPRQGATRILTSVLLPVVFSVFTVSNLLHVVELGLK